MERGEDPFLKNRLEVDQNIPATDQVNARKRRVPGQVLTREGTHVPDGLNHPVVPVGLDEKTCQAFRTNLGQRGPAVNSGPSMLDCRLTDICGKELHRYFAQPVAE